MEVVLKDSAVRMAGHNARRESFAAREATLPITAIAGG